MDLSIIIPSFNTKKLLSTCLDTVIKSFNNSDMSYEIIVVDNGSTDGTKEQIEKDFKRVIKLFNKSNVGYGASNNLGLKKAKGEYILLLNSDTEIVGNALEVLYCEAKSHPKTFVGAKLFNSDTTPQASAGPEYNLWTVFLMLFCKGDHMGWTRSSPGSSCGVDWVSGACMLGKRADFEAVGGFDEDIFMYMDEMDFLFRARSMGYKVRFVSEAHVVHVGAASSGSRKDPVGQIFRGLAYYYRKHYNKRSQIILGFLLRLKAKIAILVGKLSGRSELVQTYEHAIRLAS